MRQFFLPRDSFSSKFRYRKGEKFSSKLVAAKKQWETMKTGLDFVLESPLIFYEIFENLKFEEVELESKNLANIFEWKH